MNYFSPIKNLITTTNTPPEQTLENHDPLNDRESSHRDNDLKSVGTTQQVTTQTLEELEATKKSLETRVAELTAQLQRSNEEKDEQIQRALKEKDDQLDTLREIVYPSAKRLDRLDCTNYKVYKVVENLFPNMESLPITFKHFCYDYFFEDMLERIPRFVKHLTISTLSRRYPKKDKLEENFGEILLQQKSSMNLSILPPQLQTLKLVNCPKLYNLNRLSSFTNLTKLEVINCPIMSLNKLPSQLKSLKIDNHHIKHRNMNFCDILLQIQSCNVHEKSHHIDLEQLYVNTTDECFIYKFKPPPPNLKTLYIGGTLTDNDSFKCFLKEGLKCLIIYNNIYVDDDIFKLLPKSLETFGFVNCPKITVNSYDQLPENLEMLIHCNTNSGDKLGSNTPLLSQQTINDINKSRKNLKISSDYTKIRKIKGLFAVDAISIPDVVLAKIKQLSPPPSPPPFSDIICKWFNHLDSLEQQKEPDKQALIEFRKRIEDHWDKDVSPEWDPIFINLIQRVAKLQHVPAEGHSFEGQFILGTYNQFSPTDRNGKSWPADSSRASCTVNALHFLSQFLRINIIEDWKEKVTEYADKENIVNVIIDEGRAHFDQIAQFRRKEHDALIKEAENNNEYENVKYLKFQQAGDSLHVSEVPNVEEIFQITPPNYLPTTTLFKDEEGNTTTTYFVELLQMLKNQEKDKLGAIITCNGYSYAIAMIQQRENTEFIIFDSHGSTRVNPHNQAFIFSTTNLKECARFLGTLIPFDDALKEREHTNKVSITIIETLDNE